MCFYYDCILIWTRFEWNFSYRNKHELHAYIVFIIIIVFLAGQESIAWILYIFHSSVSFLSVLSLCLHFWFSLVWTEASVQKCLCTCMDV